MGAVYFIAAKVAGIFIFIFDLLNKVQAESKGSAAKKRIITAAKVVGLFLVTGLPVSLIVLLLLQASNETFYQWTHNLLNFDNLWSHFWLRVLFVLFMTPYLITEMYFAKEIHKSRNELMTKNIVASKELRKYWVAATVMTLVLLNIFYLVFVFAETKYDFSNVRELLFKKGYDSYSQLAVTRFWELIIVSFINLSIIYFVVKPARATKKLAKWLNTALLANGGLLLINTLFLIYSANQRISLYEQGYGLTNKRFLAHTFLPVLVCITFLVFSGLIWKRYNNKIRVALSLIALFIGTYVMLPTEYIINKINYDRANTGKIVVYDPIYTIDNRYPYLYSSMESDQNAKSFYQDLPENDIESFDGLFIANELLKTDKLTDVQRGVISYKINQFLSTYNNACDQLSWREFNFSKWLLLRTLKPQTTDFRGPLSVLPPCLTTGTSSGSVPSSR